MTQEESANKLSDELTDKQREVLDLLIEHKTSKEIARDLGISPHTVEQRLRYAKAKLGVERRSDLAIKYRSLRHIYEKSVYDDLQVEHAALKLPHESEPTAALDLIDKSGELEKRTRFVREDPISTTRMVPSIFEGRLGTWMRIGAVFAIAACIIVIGLGGMAVLEQLSRLLD